MVLPPKPKTNPNGNVRPDSRTPNNKTRKNNNNFFLRALEQKKSYVIIIIITIKKIIIHGTMANIIVLFCPSIHFVRSPVRFFSFVFSLLLSAFRVRAYVCVGFCFESTMLYIFIFSSSLLLSSCVIFFCSSLFNISIVIVVVVVYALWPCAVGTAHMRVYSATETTTTTAHWWPI